jgi:hypothetical protein
VICRFGCNTCTITRHLNGEEKGTAQMNITKELEWLQYYKQQWKDDTVDNNIDIE